MKKLLSMLLAVVVLFSTASVSAYAAGDDGLVITGCDVEAKPGATVEVPIIIEKNSGFATLNLEFTYPAELIFVSATNEMSELTFVDDKTLIWLDMVGAMAGSNFTKTGKLAVLTFTISADAESKGYSIVFKGEASDADENDIAISTTSATILVDSDDEHTHNWATTYSKDATGHWYACQTSGCDEKKDFATHTPDHQGSATEDYAIKCTACQYEMEAQLAHTHVYDKEVVKEVYKASNATCDNAATYYKSCKCGAFQSNETFSYGEPAEHQWIPATCTTPKSCSACPVTDGEALGHTEGTEWKTDGTNHWHICTVSSCGAVIESSKAAHTPDREEPTEEADVLCTECGYMMATIRQVHYHVHSNEWSFNQYEHWHACACSNRAFIAVHEDANLDGKCDICKWDVPLPEGVTAPVVATIPTSPVTGHNSTVWIWTTLAGLCGFAYVVTNVLRKKK